MEGSKALALMLINELKSQGYNLKEIKEVIVDMDEQIIKDINKDVATNGKSAYVNPKLKPLSEYVK